MIPAKAILVNVTEILRKDFPIPAPEILLQIYSTSSSEVYKFYKSLSKFRSLSQLFQSQLRSYAPPRLPNHSSSSCGSPFSTIPLPAIIPVPVKDTPLHPSESFQFLEFCTFWPRTFQPWLSKFSLQPFCPAPGDTRLNPRRFLPNVYDGGAIPDIQLNRQINI